MRAAGELQKKRAVGELHVSRRKVSYEQFGSFM
jgi:hypothetical protein